MAEGLLVCMT